jgi:hypothetical protein
MRGNDFGVQMKVLPPCSIFRFAVTSNSLRLPQPVKPRIEQLPRKHSADERLLHSANVTHANYLLRG